jgi:DNA (cytosine-5)-methyltransferase 1
MDAGLPMEEDRVDSIKNGKNTMKYLSLFSGIGGFELGIQYAYENKENRVCETRIRTSDEMGSIRHNGDSSDHNNSDGSRGRTRPICIGFSEIDKYAIQIYKKHFNHKNYGDITTIQTNELPNFDILVGGFPCQSFSIAGKRGGFDDTRGTLFFEIARILRDKRPRYFLLENVKGLLSHDNGKTFQTILKVLTDLGYDVEWQVLNSKNHGVPQNRERIFFVGYIGGGSRPKVFPIGECDQRIDGANEETSQTNIARTVDARIGSYPKWGQYINQINNPTHSNNRLYGEDGISPSLNTAQGGNRQPKIADYRNDEGLRIRKGNESPCLSARRHSETDISTMPPLSIEHSKIRRLTPVECERLQGFPDNWTKYGINEKGEEVEISDTQRYKTLGNAVTVNVIKETMTRIDKERIAKQDKKQQEDLTKNDRRV